MNLKGEGEEEEKEKYKNQYTQYDSVCFSHLIDK